MQTSSAEPGKARRWLSPVLLRSAEAVNSSLDFGCPVQSVINDKCTLQGLANGAAAALKPRPALCEMTRVPFTRLCRTQHSSGRVVPSRRAVPQAGRASPHAWCSALSVCPCGARALLQCHSLVRCWGTLPVPPPGSLVSPFGRSQRG